MAPSRLSHSPIHGGDFFSRACFSFSVQLFVSVEVDHVSSIRTTAPVGVLLRSFPLGCPTSFIGLWRHGRGDCKVRLRLTDGSVSLLAFSLARIGGVPLCRVFFALFEPRDFLATGVGRVASRPVILTVSLC